MKGKCLKLLKLARLVPESSSTHEFIGVHLLLQERVQFFLQAVAVSTFLIRVVIVVRDFQTSLGVELVKHFKHLHTFGKD